MPDAMKLLSQFDILTIQSMLEPKGLYLVEAGDSSVVVKIGTPPENRLQYEVWDLAVAKYGVNVQTFLEDRGLAVRTYKGREYIVRTRPAKAAPVALPTAPIYWN